MGDGGTARGGRGPPKHLMWYKTRQLGKREPKWTFNCSVAATWGEITTLAGAEARPGADTLKRRQTKATAVSSDGYSPSNIVPHVRKWTVRGVSVVVASQPRHSCPARPTLAELEGGVVPDPSQGGKRELSQKVAALGGGRKWSKYEEETKEGSDYYAKICKSDGSYNARGREN